MWEAGAVPGLVPPLHMQALVRCSREVHKVGVQWCRRFYCVSFQLVAGGYIRARRRKRVYQCLLVQIAHPVFVFKGAFTRLLRGTGGKAGPMEPKAWKRLKSETRGSAVIACRADDNSETSNNTEGSPLRGFFDVGGQSKSRPIRDPHHIQTPLSVCRRIEHTTVQSPVLLGKSYIVRNRLYTEALAGMTLRGRKHGSLGKVRYLVA